MALRITMNEDRQHELLEWAACRSGMDGAWPRGTSAVGSISEDGDIRAVLVIVRVYDCEADLHFVSDGSRRWASPRLLAAGLCWLFDGLGVPRVRANIDRDNTAALTMALRVGMKIEGVTTDGLYNRRPSVLLSMRHEDAEILHRYVDREG